MDSSPLRFHDFAIYVDNPAGRKYIIDKWASFDVDESGVYTLEGKNQSGKSILIKTLMGVLVPNVKKEMSGKVFINEEPVTIRRVSDAINNGLVAVFQDDQLIPSMTIREQFILHHGTPAISNYMHSLYGYLYDKSLGKLDKILKSTTGFSIPSKLSPSESKRYRAKQIVDRAKELLKSYGSKHVENLDKYPRQLSGSGKSVARLVNAQLHQNTKVLFLDEAFSGVQKDSLPKIISQLKQWANEKSITLVIVTHNREELIKWQPKKRFLIDDESKIITSIKPDGYSRLEAGLPLRVDMFPVYTPPYSDEAWILELKKNSVVSIIIDERIIDHQSTNNILSFLRKVTGDEPKLFSVVGGEALKQYDKYRELIGNLAERHPRQNGAIIVIGGGTTLNFGGFVGSTLHRGWLSIILVPTTIMSIADVAVGSKTSLNIQTNSLGLSQKHIIGTYNNPSAIILDKEYLSRLPNEELRIGLAEIIKHGLLQSKDLFIKALELLENTKPEYLECFEVAFEAMNLKSHVLAIDPWENEYGRILLYGHLHAHSIERASQFSIQHGVSVLWGIIMDLKMAGNVEIYKEVLLSVKKSNLLDINIIEKLVEDRCIEVSYEYDTKDVHVVGHKKYNLICMEAIGQYGAGDCHRLEMKEVDWDQINSAIKIVIEEYKAIST